MAVYSLLKLAGKTNVSRVAMLAIPLGIFGCAAGGVDADRLTKSALTDSVKLASAVAARSEDDRSRDGARHPQETITFFEVASDMKVLEVLPGRGWYTRVLAPYLSGDGELHGVMYAHEMLPMFGFFSDERIAAMKQQMAEWPAFLDANGGAGVSGVGASFGRAPASWDQNFDRIIMIRALHNLNRFEADAGTRTSALKQIHRWLKTDGTVGVVQHRAPENAETEWAQGQNGYLKQSEVIAMFEEAGFTLVGESAVNANPLDRPRVGDFVWRLPPSLRGHDDDASKDRATAIGESDRMTLIFRKS